MCVYIYICIYVCIYIYIYIHRESEEERCVYISLSIYIYIEREMYTCVRPISLIRVSLLNSLTQNFLDTFLCI